VEEASRRAGDSHIIVAHRSLIKRELGWQPQYDDLSFIIKTARAWEQKNSTI